MKNHISSTVGSIDQQLKLDTLGGLFTRLATMLGPCTYGGIDRTREVMNALPMCDESERPRIIESNWSARHLDSIRNLLQQISLLEEDLRQQKHAGNGAI